MNKKDMATIAKIIKDTVKIHEESYDNGALNEATMNWHDQFGEDSFPCISYSKFYRKNLCQSAHEAIKIHSPELDGINYGENEIIPEPAQSQTNLFAHFIYLTVELAGNDMLDWSDYVLSNVDPD